MFPHGQSDTVNLLYRHSTTEKVYPDTKSINYLLLLAYLVTMNWIYLALISEPHKKSLSRCNPHKKI